MFSFGCCLFELATGHPMLRSRDNNHHMKLILEYKGMPSKTLLSKALFRPLYFDENSHFLETMPDPATGKVRSCPFSTDRYYTNPIRKS